MKFIYLPLEHIESRYTYHLDRDIEQYLNDNLIEYIKLYPSIGKVNSKFKSGSFLDAEFTIQFKADQISMLAHLYRNDMISDGDVIFSSDLWHPGLAESVAYMNYFSKKNVKLTGLVHAGSFTDTDFVRDMERWAKNLEENTFDISSKIFVASDFIKNDICKKRLVDKNKLIVTGLPLDFIELNKFKSQNEKENIVIFNGRNVDEKQPHLFDRLQDDLKNDIKFVNTQKENLSKKDYYSLLAKSKCVVSFALQENFGFGVLEAAFLGCVPVVPNRLVYPELYPDRYLYNSFDECKELVLNAIENYESPKYINYSLGNCFSEWFKIS